MRAIGTANELLELVSGYGEACATAATASSHVQIRLGVANMGALFTEIAEVVAVLDERGVFDVPDPS